MSAAELEQIRHRTIVDGASASEIARELHSHSAAIVKHAAHFRETFMGPLRPCLCGRPAGHSGFCSKTAFRAQPLSADQILTIRARLIAGDTADVITSRFQIGRMRIHGLVVTLSDDEARLRQQRMWQRIAAARVAGAHVTAQRDPTFARILAAMPAGMEPTLRDEACAEMYLAILEGDLGADEIEAEAAQFRGDAYRDWASSFGATRSMDVAIGAEDSRTLHELLGDSTAEDVIDDIEIGATQS